VADYHIKEFYSKQAAADSLSQNPPGLIVILPEGEDFPQLMSLVEKKYVSIVKFDGALIYKINTTSVKSYTFP
jgi:hypothetical protein